MFAKNIWKKMIIGGALRSGLTLAISGGALSARRLLIETYTRRGLSVQAA
jgi:hypothetical protein